MRDEAFLNLFHRRPTHIKPGLARIEAALSHAPSLHTLRPILVGGTNGKGSTAAFLWQLMSQTHPKTLLFTSPHLIHFRERFTTEPPVSDEELLAILGRMKDALAPEVVEPLSFFEISTLLAVWLLAERGGRYGVFEVGLGGRLDSTNALDPMLSIITSIGFDHMAYLGHRIDQIAYEKRGIAREGRPLVCGKMTYKEASAVLRAHKGPVFEWGRDFGIREGEYFGRTGLGVSHLPLPAAVFRLAPYMKENLSLALCSYQLLHEADPGEWPPLSDLALLEGPEAPCLRGRFQKGRLVGIPNQTFLIDVCHNPDGAKRLQEAVAEQETQEPLPALVSILDDKDQGAILDVLRSFLSPIVLFKVDDERCTLNPKSIKGHEDLEVYPCFQRAYEALRRKGPNATGPVVVCGSVLAVGRVFEEFTFLPENHLGPDFVPTPPRPGGDDHSHAPPPDHRHGGSS